MVNGIGGISAIAISHPYYFTSTVRWSRAVDYPLHLHAVDRQWTMRPDAALEFWNGETNEIGSGLTLIRCTGRFEGGTEVQWAE